MIRWLTPFPCRQGTDPTPARTTSYAIRNALNCEHCRRDLTDTEPVYRVRLWENHPWVRRYPTVLHLCSDCADTMRRKWHPARPCDNCARPVHHGENYKVPLHVTCGPVCRNAIKAAQARALRRPPIFKCQSCGTPFGPKRADARFCSVGCKQRAYRRRLANEPEAAIC